MFVWPQQGVNSFTGLPLFFSAKPIMRRRTFLATLGTGLTGSVLLPRPAAESLFSTVRQLGPVHSIIPVVGDGVWIWNEPPRKSAAISSRVSTRSTSESN